MSDPDRAPSVTTEDDLLPVRMLTQYAYCPRLFYLMHVEGQWADNAYTAEGRHVHRRVDAKDQPLPDAQDDSSGGDDPPEIARSVSLGSPRLRLTGKLDLVSVTGNVAIPVETKRGRPPDNEHRSWEPERVQLMAQGLLLREHGYTSPQGFLYFAGARTRVPVPFTDELEAMTLRLLEEAHQVAAQAFLPPPLVDSPKCLGCSLNGICLPDETNALNDIPPDPTAKSVRRLYPSHANSRPLYVQEQGARIGNKGTVLLIRKQEEVLAEVRLRDVSQVVLCGSVTVNSRALHLLTEADIPIVHLTSGHWFCGITQGFGLRNAFDRAAQFRAAADPERCLTLARAFIEAKVHNQRVLLRRNADPLPEAALRDLKHLLPKVRSCPSLQSLLGLEGTAARHYFAHLPDLLRPPEGGMAFHFSGRNTRPPRDPVNALLSFGYAMLSKECAVSLTAIGLDPHWGFFHQPRHGRPSLALDLMEEFRPLIVDSAVITAINTGMVTTSHFTITSHGCSLGPLGRKAFIQAYETRLAQLATHPLFDYRATWRQIIKLQAQLLARYLRADISTYTGITTR